jgi:plasmid stabilization system protein ParE
MVAESRRMRVSLSSAAIADLGEIWDWNAGTYGPDHAHRYIAFLRAETAKLATFYFAGKPVPTRPKLSYVTIRRHRKGHGHVGGYELIGDVVYVLHYYHSAQDWQNKLLEEKP